MNRIIRRRLLAATASSLLVAGLVMAAPARAALDQDITISFTALANQITWQLAGKDVDTAGVSGSLGPFANACAILQGSPTAKGNVIKRDLYVLDAGTSTSAAVLYVYARTDTITSGEGQKNDAVTIVPSATVPLALSGAANTSCYMAANDTAIFAGNSANLSAEVIYKGKLAHEAISQPLQSFGFTVSAITASDNGIVFITWGTGPESGWAEYDRDSKYLATGQYFEFTVLAGSTNATTF